MDEPFDFPVSSDRLLGGRLMLLQPQDGYRAAIDPVLLAAAVPAMSGELAVDLGCGVGTAGLCLAARVPGLRVFGLDSQPGLIRLAIRNADVNDLAGRVQFQCGDILDFHTVGFDHILVNPPYLARGSASISPNPIKAKANVEGDAGLVDWVNCAIAAVRPGGSVSFIHRADRGDELCALMTQGLGDIAWVDLLPREGGSAKRVILQGIRGSAEAGPARRSMVLHQSDGRFTAETEAVLREMAAIRVRD
ncbi:MAG: methyltransferase [Rhodospirillaceae bacterium]|nr:methyltransferase [Rhodospirillaceae bacterium]